MMGFSMELAQPSHKVKEDTQSEIMDYYPSYGIGRYGTYKVWQVYPTYQVREYEEYGRYILLTRYASMRREWPHQGQDKERQPADEEGEDYDTHSQGSLPLLAGVTS